MQVNYKRFVGGFISSQPVRYSELGGFKVEFIFLKILTEFYFKYIAEFFPPEFLSHEFFYLVHSLGLEKNSAISLDLNFSQNFKKLRFYFKFS